MNNFFEMLSDIIGPIPTVIGIIIALWIFVFLFIEFYKDHKKKIL